MILRSLQLLIEITQYGYGTDDYMYYNFDFFDGQIKELHGIT